MKGAWVLTFEVNDYDQHGEYFLTLFDKEPSIEILADFFHKSNLHIGSTLAEGILFLERLKRGGGRSEKMEGTWYHLKFVTWGNLSYELQM